MSDQASDASLDDGLTATFVDMPPARLAFPQRPEEAFPMRHEDWQRIRARTAKIRIPSQTFGNIAWAMLGLGSGSAVALLTWLPARSELSAAEWAWVTPALIVIAIAAFAIMTVCLLAQRQLSDDATEDVENVLADMDQVYDRHQALRAVP